MYFIGLFLSSAGGGEDGGMKDIAFLILSGDCVLLLRNALLLPGGRKEGSKELQTERSALLEFGIKDSG